jgi:hypothetical protein
MLERITGDVAAHRRNREADLFGRLGTCSQSASTRPVFSVRDCVVPSQDWVSS